MTRLLDRLAHTPEPRILTGLAEVFLLGLGLRALGRRLAPGPLHPGRPSEETAVTG